MNKKLKEKEREILETYELIRQQHNKYAFISKINRNLIDMNNSMEKYISELEIMIANKNDIAEDIKRQVFVTLNRIDRKSVV